MNAYPEWSLLFDEDGLPPGQQPIVTAGIRQFRTASEMLMHSKQTGYSTMGVVTGWPGVVGVSLVIRSLLSPRLGVSRRQWRCNGPRCRHGKGGCGDAGTDDREESPPWHAIQAYRKVIKVRRRVIHPSKPHLQRAQHRAHFHTAR